MGDHPIYAALYDRLTRPMEEGGLARRRGQLLSVARGRVLEVGGGTGANLAHYPADVTLTVLEPDGAMRRRMLARDPALAIIPTCTEDADFPPDSFDTVVCTLVLCTVDDLGGALARIPSWLRPDRQLLFLEHVHAGGARGRLQTLATPVWSRVVPGCRLDRDPVVAMRAAGLAVTDCERFHLPRGNVFVGAAVQGAARLRSAA